MHPQFIIFVLLMGLTCASYSQTGPSITEGTRLGDWGHFLSYSRTIHLNNPDGVPFSVEIGLHKWTVDSWNPATTLIRLEDPDGSVVFSGEHPIDNDSIARLDVESASPGVYTLYTTRNNWVSSTLRQSVVWTGVPGRHIADDLARIIGEETEPRKPEFYEREGQIVFMATVPRRWWFWVPADTRQFTCNAMRADRYMSQREDWGFFIISPRGQRMRSLWGQPNLTSGTEYRQDQSVTVDVEPGTAGRFWCLEVAIGDSHQYSNINISLDGVPPYLSRSPEEWFDPASGAAPPVSLYDESPFIQSAPLPGMDVDWPNVQHFSPAPSLGDPDGIEIMGDADFSIWNPEDRDILFNIGSYLPRTHGTTPENATVTFLGADDRFIDEVEFPIIHLHGSDKQPVYSIGLGNEVGTVAVSGVERWIAFTYPATPLVLNGRMVDGWATFRFTVCGPRNWYFYVPKGTRDFSLSFSADFASDIIQFEVCSPDRTVALSSGNQGQMDIHVPDGLDGKMWYLRPSIGGATTIGNGTAPDYRYQDSAITVWLKGVPGYLSPTWEQWFNPEDPQLPLERLEIIPDTPATDLDLDGLDDGWEIAQFGNLDQLGSGDPDDDGLINEQEETAGTDPLLPDTDEDGLDDGAEVAYGLNPLVAYPNPAVIAAHLDTLRRNQGQILAQSPSIWPENGMIHLQLQLLVGEDLLNMAPLDEPVDFSAPAPLQGPLFYQINVE